MRVGLSSIVSCLLLCAPVLAQYELGAGGAPPESLPPALATALDPNGAKVSTGGKVWCEVWTAKSLAAGPKSAEEAVSLPTVQHGALLGVIRFPSQASDRRGNPVPAGVYAMRYSIFPNDGAHMGAAPQRDFAILIPIARDKAPDALLSYDLLMALSKEATGAPHPYCLSLMPSSEQKFPSLHKEERDWVLHLKIGGQPVSLIVVGRAEG